MTYKIVIVGAGISGLSLAMLLGRDGHSVTVLEAAREIKEVGSAINCAPNLTRMMARWGLSVVMRENGALDLVRMELKSWRGHALGTEPMTSMTMERYGSPMYSAHRADLHQTLYEAAMATGQVTMYVDHQVVSVDFEAPRVTCRNGRTFEAELVVGADGLKSICRVQFYRKLGLVDRPRPTGDAAFRALIPIDEVVCSTELKMFMRMPQATRWMGPGRHVQAYPTRGFKLYNLVMLHPDLHGSVESWDTHASKQELLDTYAGWDPRLQELLGLIPDGQVMKWQLCDHDALPTWVMDKVVLIGDACHPMLPYVGLGAATGIEDAACLRIALAKAKAPQDLPRVCKAYENAQKPRASFIAGASHQTRMVLHYPDGPDQEARDLKFKGIVHGGDNPDLLGDNKSQQYFWGYDAELEFAKIMTKLPNDSEKQITPKM